MLLVYCVVILDFVYIVTEGYLNENDILCGWDLEKKVAGSFIEKEAGETGHLIESSRKFLLDFIQYRKKKGFDAVEMRLS